MYRFEPDAHVRHAVVVALGQRPERTRANALRLAADLDGDERVRSAARLALSGVRLSSFPAGRGTLWLGLSGEGASQSTPPEVRVGTSSGVVLPMVADPDGMVVVSGLPEGPIALRLAPGAAGGNAPSR
jgi:hypothetical protein